MAEKTTGLYVRMNPEKKEKAEAILKKLGFSNLQWQLHHSA